MYKIIGLIALVFSLSINAIDRFKILSVADLEKLLSQKNRDFKPCNECNVRGDLIGRPNFEQWMKRHET